MTLLYPLQQYPDAVGFDVTNKTNKEERPQFRATVISSNNKNIPVWDAFLPSGSSWVFQFMFQDCFQYLFGNGTSEKVRICMVDQDPNCNGQLEDAIAMGILPNAKLRLCSWHKINRNFELEGYIKCNNTGNPKDHFVLRTFTKWFYSLCKTCEFQAELEMGEKLMFRWLEHESGVTQSLASYIREYWTEKFLPNKSRLLLMHYKNVPGGFLSANSFQESENKALKYDTAGPNAQHSLDMSAKMTLGHTLRRYAALEADILKSLTSSVVSNTPGEQYKTHLYENVVQYSVDQCLAQYEQRSYYRCYKVTDTDFYVRRAQWSPLNHIEMDSENGYRRVGCTFDRTRSVTIAECGQVTCSCGFFQQHGHPCRHFYSLFDTIPLPQHFHYKKSKAYASFYGKKNEYTDIFKKKDWDIFGPTIGSDVEPCLERLSSHSLEWFEEALPDKAPILRPGLIHDQPSIAETLFPQEEDDSAPLPNDDIEEEVISKKDLASHGYDQLQPILSAKKNVLNLILRLRD